MMTSLMEIDRSERLSGFYSFRDKVDDNIGKTEIVSILVEINHCQINQVQILIGNFERNGKIIAVNLKTNGSDSFPKTNVFD